MSRLKVVAIVQARVDSTRLPGKVLMPLNDKPMLAVILSRINRAKFVNQMVVATTIMPQDGAIEALVSDMGVACFRGSEEDVLDRYYQVARNCQADIIVRLTADNPLVDSGFVDWALSEFGLPDPRFDYLGSVLSKSLPLGLSVEVFTFAALETAWREDRNPKLREHVTPFLYRHPERFCLGALSWPKDCSAMRWTVDTPEDMEFVRTVFTHFGNLTFTWQEALAAVEAHTEWMAINCRIQQRTI